MSRLLTDGNSKLGAGIGAWSIPAGGKWCPGASESCESLCYAGRYAKRWGTDYRPKAAATKRDNFVEKMVEEAQYRTVVRIHVSGDFYSADYVRKWAEIARRCPGTLFYGYTRSWRDPSILPALRALKAIANIRLLWSCDAETGVPEELGDDVAYMSLDDGDLPPRKVKIVFRVKRKTVMAKAAGSVVCPVENGIKNEVTCGRCRICFK